MIRIRRMYKTEAKYESLKFVLGTWGYLKCVLF